MPDGAKDVAHESQQRCNGVTHPIIVSNIGSKQVGQATAKMCGDVSHVAWEVALGVCKKLESGETAPYRGQIFATRDEQLASINLQFAFLLLRKGSVLLR